MLEIKIPLFHSRPKKVQYRRVASQINDVKKIEWSPKNLPSERVKKLNPKIWGPNLITYH